MPSDRIEPLNDSRPDIVERLRSRDGDWYDQRVVMDEAADEIERLRERLEEMSLAYIEVANPGIDMDEVRRSRAE